MARLQCKCGEELSNSNNPEVEYNVFSDSEWNTLIDRTESGEKPLDFEGYKISFWKCTSCSRLYFFEPQNDIPLHIYKVENRREWYPEKRRMNEQGE